MFALDKFAYLRMSSLPRVNIFETDRSRKRLNRKDIGKTELEKLTQFSAIIMLLKKCEMSHLLVNCSRSFPLVEPLKSYMRKGQDNTKFYYFQAL